MLQVRVFLLMTSVLAAGNVLAQKWSEIKIPQDSLQPRALKFADSLTGYFYGTVPVPYDDGLFIHTHGRHYWYRTTDGGRSWLPIDFGGLLNNEYLEDSTGNRNYHSFPVHFEHSNSQSRLLCFGKTVVINPGNEMTNGKYVFLISTDRGSTWKEQESEPSDPTDILRTLELGDAFASNLWVATADLGHARFPVKTLDGGKTFLRVDGDDVFVSATTDTSDEGTTYRLSIALACSSPDRWTAFVRPFSNNDTNQKKTEVGFRTLVTDDGGDRWKPYHYFLPSDSSVWIRGLQESDGGFQAIRNTSSLYFPTNRHYHRQSSYIPYSLSKYYSGQSFLGSNDQRATYLYSSDFGVTWNPDTSYYRRHFSFFAVAPGNVWMTLWRSELVGYTPSALGMFADVIVHTTDFGKTWTEDSITLHPQEFTPLDGHFIYFTDPNHGWIAASNQFGTSIFRYRGEPSSVDEHQTSAVDYQLYPNPANEVVNVATSLNIQQLEVYGALGRTYRCHYELTDGNAVVDCSQLTPGYYFVRLTALQGGQTKATTKFFSILR